MQLCSSNDSTRGTTSRASCGASATLATSLMTTTRTDNLNASLGANELEIEVAQAGEDGGSASYRFSTWAALIDIIAKLRVSAPNVSEKRVPRDLFPGLSSEDHLVFATSPDFWTGLGVPEYPGCRASASKTLSALVVSVEGWHTGSTRVTKHQE